MKMKKTMMQIFVFIVKQELQLAWRRLIDIANPVIFFVIIVSLFPLAITSDTFILHRIAAGIIWVGALMAALLGLDQLFLSDFLDGTLEQYCLSPQPLTLIVFAKIFAHWLITGVPLILISPVLGLLLSLHSHEIFVLMLSLLIGTPILSLIGAIAQALVVGLNRGGVLLALLVLPLCVPVLIFGAGSVMAVISELNYQGLLALLGAQLLLFLPFAPLAAAGAVKARHS